jgi:hypothetical protein
MIGYREIQHLGCDCLVNEDGDVFTKDSKGEYVHRDWRSNKDGYAVVSATGFNPNGKRYYRTIQVHILVAKAFIPNDENKPEVNHKDFDRWNPKVDNLEWMTHAENVRYSAVAGRKGNIRGDNNPNYGNRILSQKYAEDKDLALEKQARKGARNGRAKSCKLFDASGELVGEFPYRRAAVEKLIELGVAKPLYNKESVIKKLSHKGYKGYRLTAA